MPAAVDARAHDAPLEDLMVAMDVVDTVRHRHLIVDRELDADSRRGRLLERLRDIYRAQGINVSDAALHAGVDALEEERFQYVPTGGGLSANLARLYARRDRWLRPLILLLLLGVLAWLAWYLALARPETQMQTALPARIDQVYARIQSVSKSDTALQQATALKSEADAAVANEKYQAADTVRAEMASLLKELQMSYQVKIVSRPNELSGVWRVPAVNPDARNYYLIVEAVASNGRVVPVRVRNEEDSRLRQVSAWGIRVSEETFEAVAADKRDDGIIQDNTIGTKEVGVLEPDYRVPTSGATITEW